jgi:acyl dehydratase
MGSIRITIRDVSYQSGMLAGMSPRIINGIDEAKSLVGEHLGYSDYLEITQQRVNQFAEATGDFQWIHVDVEKANAYPSVLQFTGFSMGINYGANKIRFPSPVPVGSKVRLGVKLLSVDDIAGGIQNVLEFTFECEGSSKPSCVAEIIFRSYT